MPITLNCCNVGANCKLGFGTSPVDRLDFIELVPTRFMQLLSDGSLQSIRGTLDPNGNTVAPGMLYIQFRVGLWLTSDKMNVLLPIMGFTNTGGTNWARYSALTPTTVTLGPSGSDEEVIGNAMCAGWQVSWAKGQRPARLDISFIASTDTEQSAGTTFISQTNPLMIEGYPYGTGQMSLSAYGKTRYANQVRLTMDYGLIVEYNNSVTATALCASKNDLTLSTSLLYSSCDGNDDLWSTPLSGSVAGSTASLGFARTDVTKSTTFSMANVKAINRFPAIIKEDFLRLPAHFQCYALGTSPMLLCSNII